MTTSDEWLAATARPETDLLFRRGDANDPRLGEVVLTQLRDYAQADVVLLGCPQDEGVRRNGGRIGAAFAPDAIRRFLYRLTVNEIEHIRLFDLGNTLVQPTLEETHERQRDVVRRIIADGKTLIVLGGGNDISYPDCAGLADAVGELLAFNVDAHFDVRADEPRNSGTPYRQLLEDGVIHPERFHEMCSQPFANSPVYARYLREKGVPVMPLDAVRASGIPAVFERLLTERNPAAVFWGLDMDSVRAADAPGVSAPNAIGLTGEEFCAIAAAAGRWPGTRLLEISEVNPVYDIDNRTSRLAAVAIWSFLSARNR
jgi:formiminoglutamase